MDKEDRLRMYIAKHPKSPIATEISRINNGGYEVPCTTLGCKNREIRNSKYQKNVRCFDCKMKRMRAYGIKYWATFRGELPAHFKTKKEVIHHIREERKKGIEVFRETARLKKLEEQALRKELRVERALDMLEMRKTEKLTLDQIGKRFNPPLTRERVRQIIAAELSLELQSEFKHYKKVASVLAHCPVCNKVKRVSLVWFKGEGKHYCAEHRPKLSAEERRAKKLDYCRNRYSSA